MKKSWIILLVLITSLSWMYVSAEVRINEIESNPGGSDSGNEWIELYSSSEISLINWTLKNNDNQSIILNKIFSGYLIINLTGQWLDNSDEKIFLYNQNELADNSIIFSDSENNNKTWQYCSSNWRFVYMTKDYENNCLISQNNTPQNNQNQSNEQTDNSEISVEVEFDEEDLINGEEFEIKVKAENLKNENYNFKIWIEDEDDDKVISDRYGKDSSGEKVWKSGEYWIYDFFEGPGDKEKNVKLKIREGSSDFYGDANLFFKIQGENENLESIEILKKQNDEDNEEAVQGSVDIIREAGVKQINEKESVSGDVIKLGGSESIEAVTDKNQDQGNEVIYKSKNEKIKLYSIIGFAVLCLGLVVLLIFKKLR